MTPSDPRWIGNWWIGILGASGICLLSATFICGFPPVIPSQKDQRKDYLINPEKEKHVPSAKNLKEDLKYKFSEFPAILKDLLTNWSFLFNCMAVNCTLMYIEGLSPFIAKVLILQYGVKAEKVGSALTISALPPMISMSICLHMKMCMCMYLCMYMYVY